MKIYADDPNLPYKTTKLKTLYTKSEIDGLFAKWGVKDVYWCWDPEHNDVFVQFRIVEEIDGFPLQVSAKVEAPVIWDRKTRSRAEAVNWNISMRVMYWFIKSHLEAAYLLQSSKTAAFLPYIVSKDGAKVLKDVIIPRINEVQQLTFARKSQRSKSDRCRGKGGLSLKKYKTWASLSAEGQAVWGDVFPDCEVPVQSIIAQTATLEGIAETERNFPVDWTELTAQQQDAVLEKLSKRSGAAKDVILKDILNIGLPLREKYIEGCGTSRMELFL